MALVSGGLDLWRQVTVATGFGLGESLAVEPFAAVLGETRYGTVWLVRHAILVLLAGVLALRDDEGARADWLALRLEGLLLTGLSLALVGAAGHAASTEQVPAAAIAVDAAHLLATGVWFGGLLPLALFLSWSLTLPRGADVLATSAATQRFSAVGLAAVTLLVASGSYNAWAQVAGFPALLGTPYGRWLCLKVGLLAPLLVVAALNLLVLKPRLTRARSGTTAPPDPHLVRRLRRHVLVEAALGCLILAVVAVLGLTTPGRHAQITWPLSFRLAWDATKDLPGVRTRVAVGSQVAMLGVVAALLAGIVRHRRWRWVLAAGALAILLGLLVALPPLAVDAHPTTYLRAAVPYTAGSIAQGRALYATHCAICHGIAGYGDGPAAGGLWPRPADLTAKHTADHTAGDLFWWLTRGIPRSAMTGFEGRLSPEGRWDLVNFVRALAAAEQARGLAPVAVPEPAVVAPDFAYTPGVGEMRALKEYRGRAIVVLALFTLPESLERLGRLNEVYRDIRTLGGEILGVPLGSTRDLHRRLGDRPILFPIAVDGAAEVAAAYGLFRRDFSPEAQRAEPPPVTHMELLIDRQGYLRARWIRGKDRGWEDPVRLRGEVERLAREAPRAAVPEEHVH